MTIDVNDRTGKILQPNERFDVVVGAGGSIALGLLSGGRARSGETLIASSPTRNQHTSVSVVAPHFYDPEGARYRD